MAENCSIAAADSTVVPPTKMWLDCIYGPVKRMSKGKIQVLIFAFRRRFAAEAGICWFPRTEDQFKEELKKRGIHDLVWETLLCEEFCLKEYDARDGWQYWVAEPNVYYGPAGAGTSDEIMEKYVALYRKVTMKFTQLERKNWNIQVFYEGRLVRQEEYFDGLDENEIREEVSAENAAAFEIEM